MDAGKDAMSPSMTRRATDSRIGPSRRRIHAPPQAISVLLLAEESSDAHQIQRAVTQASQALAELVPEFEIYVVRATPDLAAADRSGQSCQSPAEILGPPDNISFPLSGGQQSIRDATSLGEAIASARHEWVLLIRTDSEIAWDELDRVLLLGRDYDIVNGYRPTVEGPLLLRVWTSAYNSLANWLFGLGTRDCLAPVRLIHKTALPLWTPKARCPLGGVELLAQGRLEGASVAEVPVRNRDEAVGDTAGSGRPEFSGSPAVRKGASCLLDLVRLWWSVLLFPAGEENAPFGLPEDLSSGPKLFRSWRAPLLLVAIAAVMLLPHLSYPFVEPDEARNAQIALEMYQSGDWITPTRWGRPYLDKPPMLFWWVSSSFSLFGPSPAAARFPVALAGMLTVGLVYWAGRWLVGARAAWIGAGMLVMSIGFVLPARFIVHDALLTLFVAATVFALYRVAELPTPSKKRTLGWSIAGAICGLGVLTKGPVCIALSVPPLLALQWLTFGAVRTRVRDWATFFLATLVVAMPWYVAASLRSEQFIEYFLWEQNVKRFLSGANHPAPWWFYIPVVFAGLFPCSLLLPGLVVFLLSRSAALRRHRPRGLGYVTLSAVWTVLFFSLSEGKLPTYVLPAAPMFALLLGQLVDAVLLKAPSGEDARLPAYLRAIRWQVPVVLIVLCVVAAIGGGIVDFLLAPDAAIGVWISWLLAVAAAVVGWRELRPRVKSPAWKWSVAGLMALLVVSNVFNDIYPDGAAVRSYLANASEAVQTDPLLARDRDAPVLFFARRRDAAAFYFGARPVYEFDKRDLPKLIEFVRTQPRGAIVARPHHIQRLASELAGVVRIRSRSSIVLIFEQIDDGTRP
ncbi:MAG: phospholipid carrier-dependent glycosyltransferase [Planctomycetes bacterium]|nr:phospholipid carrier-dependent glycosyltransferase [Planctomycetota bacterium]